MAFTAGENRRGAPSDRRTSRQPAATTPATATPTRIVATGFEPGGTRRHGVSMNLHDSHVRTVITTAAHAGQDAGIGSPRQERMSVSTGQCHR